MSEPTFRELLARYDESFDQVGITGSTEARDDLIAYVVKLEEKLQQAKNDAVFYMRQSQDSSF